jgi:MoaA/NifB/PqqE/SkfB family radical SAM enzyme
MELEKNTGICGPQFLYPAGNFQSSFGRFPTAWREWLRFSYLYNIIPGATIAKHTWLKKIDLERPQSVDWLSGGCFLIRRNVIEEVGLFDENYFLGVEDMDYCYRAKKLGWAVVYHPLTQAVHYHGLSSGGVRNILRFTHDRDGLGYFFRKNRPQDRFSPNFVSALYNLKIMMLKLQTAVKNFRSDSHRPQDATMAVTYRCNSRCRMCNIWQEKGSAELPLKAFTHLSPNIKYVNLTGGEPFLRDDLPLIVRAVKKASPQAQIIISSNGLATERIVNAMADIIDIDKNVGVRVSLDGTGAAHDRIRGIPGIYERALTTIEKLRVLGVENLGISFTIMDTNIDELRTVYKLAKDLGLQLALALVQNSDIYFKKGDNRLTALAKIKLALDYVIASELKSFNPKKWLRAYYDYGLYYYAWHGKRLLPSGAGFDSLFVDPSGTVYPSNLINLPMGNLTDDSIDKLWSGSIAVKTREKIISENIQESWIICTIRGEMKKHLAQVLIWIVKNKTRVHLKDLKGYLSGFWFKQYAGGVYPSK